MSAEHEAVPGGFRCRRCGAVRQTPLGIAPHRGTCQRGEQ